jgi:transcriptional regulator with XRE-family HTH domain
MSLIGDNIKKYREVKGLTQEYIAESVGKSKNVVSNWERGDNKPDADIITMLCGILGVDANTLMGWTNKEQLKQDVRSVSDQILNNDSIKDVLPSIADLSNDDMELLKNFIKRLKAK